MKSITTMKSIQTRLFQLMYSQDDLPNLESKEELNAFYQMIGKVACYGMLNADPIEKDGITLVTSYIAGKNEVMSEINKRVPAWTELENGDTQYYDSPKSRVEEVVKELRGKDGAFVICAIKGETDWSTHS